MTQTEVLSPESVARLFTEDHSYRFARWGRPIAPVVFGTDDASLDQIKTAINQTVHITGATTAETDPELGSNFMWFFCANWSEVAEVPDLDKLIPNLTSVLGKLETGNSNLYRYFAFDADGGIKFCAILVRLQGAVAELPIQTLITGEVVQSLLLWSSDAFAENSPIAVVKENGICIVKPEYAALIRAAYDPVLPVSATDQTHALRLSARASLLLEDLQDDA
jgi:hypothetical protein